APVSSSPTCASTSTTRIGSSCICSSSSTRVRPKRPPTCSRRPPAAPWRSPHWPRSPVRRLRPETTSTKHRPTPPGLGEQRRERDGSGGRQLVDDEEQQVKRGGQHQRQQRPGALASNLAGQYGSEQGRHEQVAVAQRHRAEQLALQLRETSPGAGGNQRRVGGLEQI